MHNTHVSAAVGATSGGGEWLVFRDVPNGLEYIRPAREVADGGFFWELDAFKYHVFMEFRTVHATRERPYDRLAAELSGRGVPSIDRAATQLYYRPVHTPLRDALSEGHVAYLLAGWDPKTKAPTKEAVFAFEEKLRHMTDGLAFIQGVHKEQIDATKVIARATKRYGDVLRAAAEVNDAAEAAKPAKTTKIAEAPAPVAVAAASPSVTKPSPALDTKSAPKAEARPTTKIEILLASVHVEAALELFATTGPSMTQGARIDAWSLPAALVEAFTPHVGEHEAHLRALLTLLAATLPTDEQPLETVALAALEDPRGRAYLGVHDAGGVTWLVKERWAELATLLAERDAVLGRTTPSATRAKASDLASVAELAGYRVEAIAKALKAEDTVRDLEPPAGPAPERTKSTPPTKSPSERPRKK
jgi:hypothetical protein